MNLQSSLENDQQREVMPKLAGQAADTAITSESVQHNYLAGNVEVGDQ